MAENDHDKLKGPSTVRSEPVEDRTLRAGLGGLTLRQIHEQVRTSVARDREAQKMKNPLAQKPGRWQRFVRYVWDRKLV